MIAEGIRVGQRKTAVAVGNGLRKSSQRRRHQAELVSGERSRLIAVHEKELSREMALFALVIVEIGDELIFGVWARRAKGTCSCGGILRRRNEEVSSRELCIQHRQGGRRNAGCGRDGASEQAGLALK